ncbi:tetratricopeptide repeat protein [Flammeovirga sp. EKP202]|uniref:tetratricopeptide repeat protein n=1 Tax=Flammeovirga sp. EKP202 TaxID=2770592 RepID=UPI00165FF9A3|nr:tetratricopeptide repeat protein [Flammeovirga sp. EKP202]MBD0404207.1 tetratricopeptide repeat protein [Flammeovirga sp. EKP202]
MLTKKLARLILVLFGFLFISTQSYSQDINELKSQISTLPNGRTKVDKLIQLAHLELDKSNFTSMQESIDKALKISDEVNYNLGRAKALMMYSTMHKLRRDFDVAIDYGLKAIKIFEQEDQDIPLYDAYGEMCFLYQDWGIYENAIDYEKKALRVAERMNDLERQTEIWYLLGNSYLLLRNYDEALVYFRKGAEYYKGQYALNNRKEDLQSYNNALSKIASIEMRRGNYEIAKDVNFEILSHKQTLGDEEGTHVPLNDIGYCFQKLGKSEKALKYFQDALAVNKKFGKPDVQNTTLLINIGTLSNQNLRHNDALKAYDEVLNIRIKQGQPGPIAQAYSYKATVYQGRGSFAEARKYFNKSSEYARMAGDYEQLEKNYKKIANNYVRTNDYKKAFQAISSLNVLKDSIIGAERRRLNEITEARIAAEQKEKEIDLLIMDQKVTEAQMKKLAEENARKAKDLELLQQEQSLKEFQLKQNELEKDKKAQELLITLNALEAEKKSKEIDQLVKTKKLNELRLQENEIRTRQREQELELLERDKELQESKIKEAETMRKVYIIMMVLLFVVIGVIVTGYIQNRSKNKKLANKNDEILGQKMEIEKQRDALESAKTQIEKAYDNIQVLSEFGQKITAILDLESINWTAYAYVNTLMDAAVFGIGIYREKYDKIEYINFLENGLSLPLFSYDMDKKNSLSVLCYKSSEEIVINDYDNEVENFLRETPDFKTSEVPKSLVYLPLITEKSLGVLTVQSYDRNAYSRNELNILRTLASYVAIALTNANAYQEIENQNKHITDSIRYAQTIQRAILPSNAKMQTGLLENFIFFKPKDIVSGDFYWFSKIDERKENLASVNFSKNDVAERIFVAALDCTGHGVPGGFMSMIGNTLLNEIINQKQVYDPAKILDMLNEGVIDALHQENKSNDDGMDVCLCMIERTLTGEDRIVFSGAKRPLYIMEPGSTEMLEYKGDNKSIGGVHKRKSSKISFSNTVIDVVKGSSIYLTTDGLQDQNNKHGKKFGKIKLIEMLQQNADKPMLEQKSALEKALDEHMGVIPQRDDITILGLRL